MRSKTTQTKCNLSCITNFNAVLSMGVSLMLIFLKEKKVLESMNWHLVSTTSILYAYANGLPCGKCNNCQRIQSQEHPDVVEIEPDGQSIKVDQIRRLQTEFSRSGYESRKKVFFIQEAEKMNASAANSLLKFLEEPPGDFLSDFRNGIVGRILPTIQSRCQIFHFQELSTKGFIDSKSKKQIPAEKAKLLHS